MTAPLLSFIKTASLQIKTSTPKKVIELKPYKISLWLVLRAYFNCVAFMNTRKLRRVFTMS